MEIVAESQCRSVVGQPQRSYETEGRAAEGYRIQKLPYIMFLGGSANAVQRTTDREAHLMSYPSRCPKLGLQFVPRALFLKTSGVGPTNPQVYSSKAAVGRLQDQRCPVLVDAASENRHVCSILRMGGAKEWQKRVSGEFLVMVSLGSVAQKRLGRMTETSCCHLIILRMFVMAIAVVDHKSFYNSEFSGQACPPRRRRLQLLQLSCRRKGRQTVLSLA